MIAGMKAIAVATLIGAGMTQIAQAGEPVTMTRIEAYSAARVDTVFDLIAMMPETTPVMVPLAQKGDLLVPPGCTDIVGDAQSECMDVAYEIESAPSIVVETREGATSILMRMDPFTLAGVTPELE
jgi:hypothetical protein